MRHSKKATLFPKAEIRVKRESEVSQHNIKDYEGITIDCIGIFWRYRFPGIGMSISERHERDLRESPSAGVDQRMAGSRSRTEYQGIHSVGIHIPACWG